ncbi:hypothetical protein CRE_13519 [Caenorhabditis remanei]|uniref:Uncharacterized protein n=1 Tax=Caenorhabditis remanei TaxID=31234 RepID=E3MR34_CAERE|nr:hypothetical protein CRE_13519 [Caenorhabditis remanei]
MSETPTKKQKRRATIFVTGPQSKRRFTKKILTLARQRLHNELAAVNTASGIEILVQIFMDEMEILRHRIRESGQRMRNFFYDGSHQIRAILLRIFSKSISSRNMIEYKNEARVIMNEMRDQTNTYKMPRYTMNDIEEVLLSDDLEDGIIQRRSEKWSYLPERQKPLYEDDEDVFSEFRKLNVPMSMTYDEDEEDRLSMPSTRTGVTTFTAEDQMAAIQNQLAMLSKQLMSLQKGGGVEVKRGSSRASSRRGVKTMTKVTVFFEKQNKTNFLQKASVEISSNSSSSSDVSEDEGKGPSVCSPSLSSNRKTSESSSSKQLSSVSIQIAPLSMAPPPPPPLPKMAPKAPLSEIKSDNVRTPSKPAGKRMTPNSLPPAETILSSRPYLTDIAQGRNLLKKTVRSPGGSPACQDRHQKRAVSSFEAALRDRFRGFHGDNSYSEQEENGDDDDVNATWDE